MKTAISSKLFLIFTFIFLFSLVITSQESQESFCTQKTGMKDIIIDIPDRRNGEFIDPEPLKHKEGEVIVFRTNFMGGKNYGIYFYQKLDGELVAYKAFPSGKITYDKAAYHREDDSTAHILLFNSLNNEKVQYMLSGKEGETTLHFYD